MPAAATTPELNAARSGGRFASHKRARAQVAEGMTVRVLVEALGAETLVTFQLGQAELVARCPASFKAAPGTSQTLYLDPAAMHLFDQASGLTL